MDNLGLFIGSAWNIFIKQTTEFVYISDVVIRNFKGLTHHMHHMFVDIIFASSFVPQKSLKNMKTLNNHIHVKCAHTLISFAIENSY